MRSTDGLVNVFVRDIEGSLAFYGGALGLVESFRTPTEGVPDHVELRAGGFTVAVSTVEAARRVHGLDPTPGLPSMEIVLWVDDVDAAFADANVVGVETITAPHDTGNGNRNAVLRDPDGNLVEIVAKVG